MREIREVIFRGKRTDNGKWVKGYLYITHIGAHEIGSYDAEINIDRFTFDVIPETVGQYTGITDKNGRKIFEGDIVDVSENPQFIYVGVALYRYGLFNVVYDKSCFMKCKITEKNDEKGLYHFLETEQYQVVGNIFDNTELLKGGEQND